ncbi:hypothetical protein GCM10023063_17770 [Arthrobacter methylotrophus]|uniref:DUF1707 domain-containing protein n=1 Tax=Arthrobacter methylotrophus TaxID=121291 RepID=A0ABV5UNT7_9MICC
MENETAGHRMALTRSAKEIKRLSTVRAEQVQTYERKLRDMRQGKTESDDAFRTRKIVVEAEFREALTALENMVRIEDEKEYAARESLARAAGRRNEALANLEGAAYAGRRAPIGEGIRLSEKDFQKAQSSVPLAAHVLFFIALIVVVFAANAKQELPTWLSIIEFSVTLLIPVIFGLRADYFARRADRRAEEKLHDEEAERERFAPTQASPAMNDGPDL